MSRLLPALLAALTLTLPAFAGPVHGEIVRQATVLGGDTDRYRVLLAAGEATYVLVSGDGSSDLDCRILDNAGNVLVVEEDETDQCIIALVPVCQGVFIIEVSNLGADNTYNLPVW